MATSQARLDRTTLSHLHRYALAQEYAGAEVVIDLFCGDGTGTLALARTAKFVFGIDPRIEMIDAAKSRLPTGGNLKFLHADQGSQFPYTDADVGLVLALDPTHSDVAANWLDTIQKVLRPGGVFICALPMFGSGAIATAIMSGFKFVHEVEQSIAIASVLGIAREDKANGHLYHAFTGRPGSFRPGYPTELALTSRLMICSDAEQMPYEHANSVFLPEIFRDLDVTKEAGIGRISESRFASDALIASLVERVAKRPVSRDPASIAEAMSLVVARAVELEMRAESLGSDLKSQTAILENTEALLNESRDRDESNRRLVEELQNELDLSCGQRKALEEALQKSQADAASLRDRILSLDRQLSEVARQASANSAKAGELAREIERYRHEELVLKSASDTAIARYRAHKARMSGVSARARLAAQEAADRLRLVDAQVESTEDHLMSFVDLGRILRNAAVEHEHLGPIRRSQGNWFVRAKRWLGRSDPGRQFEVLLTAGDEALAAGDWKRALETYVAAIKLDPDASMPWTRLGHALGSIGENGAAEAAYRRALELSPNNADLYVELGLYLKRLGRWSGAAKAFAEALRIDPGKEVARLELDSQGIGDSRIAIAASEASVLELAGLETGETGV